MWYLLVYCHVTSWIKFFKIYKNNIKKVESFFLIMSLNLIKQVNFKTS
jgi:hypothetical protein